MGQSGYGKRDQNTSIILPFKATFWEREWGEKGTSLIRSKAFNIGKWKHHPGTLEWLPPIWMSYSVTDITGKQSQCVCPG